MYCLWQPKSFFFKCHAHRVPDITISYVDFLYKFLLMTAFEPQTSGIRSNCSTNWAKTTAQCRCLLEQETAYLYRAWFHKTDSGKAFKWFYWSVATGWIHYLVWLELLCLLKQNITICPTYFWSFIMTNNSEFSEWTNVPYLDQLSQFWAYL